VFVYISRMTGFAQRNGLQLELLEASTHAARQQSKQEKGALCLTEVIYK